MGTWFHHQFLTWLVYLLFKHMIALPSWVISQLEEKAFAAYKLTLRLDHGRLVLLRSSITINIHRNSDLNRLNSITISSQV